MERPRTLVAMSGGVDSSVAAALLVEQGHQLVGVTMHLWDASGEEKVGRCCAPEDQDMARETCELLGFPHFVFDERASFRQRVVDPFIETYRQGRTPSPCVWCNQSVKLGRLAQLADDLGAHDIATGHYARTQRCPDTGRVQLLRGVDATKDQSYFLYGVSQEVLSRMIFPLGELTKDQTRDEGRRLGVPNWDKKDSQELCFVPDGQIGAFVERQSGGLATGRLVSESGETLGTHEGIHHFTVGQRKGLGLGGGTQPRYVLRIVAEHDEVVVGPAASLGQTEARATDVFWTAPRPPEPFEASVQVRYRHRAAPAMVTPTETGFAVRFQEPQRAIAPGQAAVVYRGPEVIGGGQLAR